MRNSTRYASVEIVMQDNHVIVIMAKGKFFFFEGRPILVAAYLPICEIIMMVIQKNLSRIILQSDSHVVINSVNKMCA